MMKKFLMLVLLISQVKAASIETLAPQAIVMDFDTGEVLFEKNADQPTVPSSMTKVMTTYMVFKFLKEGKITLDTKLPVSEKAWRMGGSRMFLNLGTQETIANLLKGIVIQSGNDACVVVAEGLRGSETAFAQDMTAEAHRLGAKNTTFKNPHGWPDEGHISTVRDLAILARRMILDFPPEYYAIHGEKEFFYNNIRQPNRNPLLDKGINCDGIKTGHTDAGGYGLIASSIVNGHRLIMVVNGLSSMKERAEESLKLLSWAQRTYSGVKVFKAGTFVTRVPVAFGAADEVALYTPETIAAVYPQGAEKDVRVEVELPTFVKASFAEGTPLGRVILTFPQGGQKIYPLLASQNVSSGGFFKRVKDSLNLMFWRRL